MDNIIKLFEDSVADEIFGSFERKNIKQQLQDKNLSKREIDFIRSKIFDIALAKVNATNNKMIVEWLENANKALNGLEKEVQNDIETFFSPGSESKVAIIEAISQAQNSLDVCVFTISDNEISNKLIEAHKRKVKVRILSDNEKLLDKGSDIQLLAQAGIPVKIDNTSNHMHHKFAIIDSKLVLTGSYNWTRSAELYNHENVIVINNQSNTTLFKNQFEKLWKEMSIF